PMTTGTVTRYDSTRGTGTVTCASGGRFPFSSSLSTLAEGDAVSFRAVGGRAGTYALDVRHACASDALAATRAPFRRVWMTRRLLVRPTLPALAIQ
ncbi:MAG: hypothetical protein AAGK21_13375, partial [Bacteroidota bacterium]